MKNQWRKITLAQVKAIARKEGQVTVYLVPSKCHPSNATWVQPTEFNVEYIPSTKQFLKVTPNSGGLLAAHLDGFRYYNCNAELGNRIHYYLKEQEEIQS